MTQKEFYQSFVLRLSEEQWRAVCSQGKTTLLAVPGSGKTTVILARIGYMILCQGVSAENILVLTFSVSATEELKKRFSDMFGAALGNQISFYTIHALCLSVLRKYAQDKNSRLFRLIGENEEHNILKEIYFEEYAAYPRADILEKLICEFSYYGNRVFSSEEEAEQKRQRQKNKAIKDRYIQYKTDHKIMDFDDLLNYTYIMLKKYPALKEEYQQKYTHIFLDEAQDTSELQFEILSLFLSEKSDFFMVGDEDQSIYSFRGANPERLLHFLKRFPNANTLLLEKNYRSGREIAGRAAGFISQNYFRHPKKMQDNGTASVAEKKVFSSLKELYEYIAAQASGEIVTAVLYRNHISALPLLDILEKKNIRYNYIGADFSFFTDEAVFGIWDLLRFGLAPWDENLFLRCCYKWNSPLKEEAVRKILEQHQQHPKKSILDLLLQDKNYSDADWQRLCVWKKFFESLPHKRMSKVLKEMSERFGYLSSRKQRVSEKVRLDILKYFADCYQEPQAFLQRMEFLQKIYMRSAQAAESRLYLSTIHGAKGKEFSRVLMIDVIDGILPSEEAIKERFVPPELQKQMEEERRVFYVGVTRAKEKLELLQYKKGLKNKEGFLFLQQFMEQASFSDDRYFFEGQSVIHKKFGEGIIIEINSKKIVVKISGRIYYLSRRRCMAGELLKGKAVTRET